MSTDAGDFSIAVPADLADSSATVNSIAQNIGTDISDLQTTLAPLADSWVGTAADGHQVTQQAWQTDAKNVMSDVGILGSIAKALGVNSDNYDNCESANTKSWQ
jgi:WXG100 family type VII secretion target